MGNYRATLIAACAKFRLSLPQGARADDQSYVYGKSRRPIAFRGAVVGSGQGQALRLDPLTWTRFRLASGNKAKAKSETASRQSQGKLRVITAMTTGVWDLG